MNKSILLRTIACQATAAKACGLALVMGAWAYSSQAAQTSAAFTVTVNPPAGTADPNTGLCTVVGAFGSSVTVTCSPGGIRFITQPPGAGQWQDNEIRYTGAGTVTSWRKVSLEYGDYLEMTVQW